MSDDLRTLHPTAESWFTEASGRFTAGHDLIPSDDPNIRGPWYAPTEYPKLGFEDLTDGTWHVVEIGRVKRHIRNAADEALWGRLRTRPVAP